MYRNWAEQQNDWTISIKEIKAAKSDAVAGTEITITDLRKEVKMRIKDGSLLNRLYKGCGSDLLILPTHVC